MKASDFAIFLGITVVVLIAIAFALSIFLPAASAPLLGGNIGVVPVKGEIVASSGLASQADAEAITGYLEQAASDPSISAILLDIDSPGGEVVATKRIVRKVTEIREKYKKPVVSYIGSLGASGAYYVAAASDYIVADEDSITGSIGVLSVFPDINGLLEKLGVRVKVVKEGSFKSMGDIYHEMTPEEEAIIKGIMDSTFSRFKADVLKFRGSKTTATVFNRVADGRIISGEQAVGYGLVDETGTKERAIEMTASLANIPGKPALRYFEKDSSGFMDLFQNAGTAFASGLRNEVPQKGSVYYK